MELTNLLQICQYWQKWTSPPLCGGELTPKEIRNKILECPFYAIKCYKMLYFAHSWIFKSLIINTIKIGSFPWQSKGHRFDSGILHKLDGCQLKTSSVNELVFTFVNMLSIILRKIFQSILSIVYFNYVILRFWVKKLVLKEMLLDKLGKIFHQLMWFRNEKKYELRLPPNLGLISKIRGWLLRFL